MTRDRGWSIRPFAHPDSTAVGEAWLAAGLEAWGGFLGERRIREAGAARAWRADLVAEDAEGVFAFVSWDEEAGEVTALFAHPRGQRRGAGRALLEAAEVALRDAGHSEASLYTDERSSEARGFYRHLGWHEQGPPRVREWHGARVAEPRYVKALRA